MSNDIPPNWIPRGQWSGLRVMQLQEQIDVRRNMMKQLVGSLYPSILTDECADLQAMCDRIAEGGQF